MSQRTYLQNRNRLTDIEKRLVVATGEGAGEGTAWEVGVSRFKLLYREQINSKVPPYSTENYIQYPKINHNGKECWNVMSILFNIILIYNILKIL